jgi:hypothetical protein
MTTVLELLRDLELSRRRRYDLGGGISVRPLPRCRHHREYGEVYELDVRVHEPTMPLVPTLAYTAQGVARFRQVYAERFPMAVDVVGESALITSVEGDSLYFKFQESWEAPEDLVRFLEDLRYPAPKYLGHGGTWLWTLPGACSLGVSSDRDLFPFLICKARRSFEIATTTQDARALLDARRKTYDLYDLLLRTFWS